MTVTRLRRDVTVFLRNCHSTEPVPGKGLFPCWGGGTDTRGGTDISDGRDGHKRRRRPPPAPASTLRSATKDGVIVQHTELEEMRL